MDNDIYDYEINCLNFTDYELIITLYTDNKILLYVFNKSKTKLKRKGANIEANSQDIDKIKNFEVDARYHKLIKTTIIKQYNQLAAVFKRDGIELLNYEINKVRFERQEEGKNKGKWAIIITCAGQYSDKR